MTTTTELSHVHRFEPATVAGRRPVLVLHGTGGDENDLLPLGRLIAPGAALLSPRGKVLEGDAPRFFRRLAEGVFDEDDLRRRADELADFVSAARETYGLAHPVAVGFSNGANIAAAVLLLRPETFAAAALLRPMMPLAAPPAVDLQAKPVLLLSGALDPIVPADNTARLAALLKASNAEVEHHSMPIGHALGGSDVTFTMSWIDRLWRSPKA